MEFTDTQPIYLQIAELICSEILAGKYVEEGRLPSVREYAMQVEVNVNTLVRSYDWLSRQEIIYNRRGLGYYVSSGAPARVAERRRKDFFERTLPEVFATMKSLGISLEEVQERYAALGRSDADGTPCEGVGATASEANIVLKATAGT